MQPDVCAQSAARFRHRGARLYPLLGHRVKTPIGMGELQQILGGQAVVLLETGRIRRVSTESIIPEQPILSGER